MNMEKIQQTYGKEDRKIVFNQALDKANVVTWKRAATVSKECAVSHATASGWLLGSLPRDVKALIRVRDLYQVDIDEWINGEAKRSDSLVSQKIARAVTILKGYEKDNNVELDGEQFATLLAMLYDESDKTEFLLKYNKILTN